MKNLKFEEWIAEKYPSFSDSDDYYWYLKYGYEECRKEVLKILNNHEDNDGFSKSVLLEKIENL